LTDVVLNLTGLVSPFTAHVLLGTSDQAINAINTLNGQNFHGYVVGVSIPPPDSFLFVEFTEEQFRNLMSPFGPIERIFLVRSLFTGESKGYGFVDYINRESASLAKQQLMSTGSKYVGGRILRVNFAEPNLLTFEDLHSKTLFVDRLPRDFTNGEVLRELFCQSGTVTFAQVCKIMSIIFMISVFIISYGLSDGEILVKMIINKWRNCECFECDCN